MSDIVLRVAAKALIVDNEGKILLLREAATYKDGTNAGRYHLPGGRIEANEPFYEGLRREVREETGLEVEVMRPLYVGEWWPTIREVPHHIIAMFMLCKTQQIDVGLSDEHDQGLWIDASEHRAYDIMDPEDKVIDAYMQLLHADKRNVS